MGIYMAPAVVLFVAHIVGFMETCQPTAHGLNDMRCSFCCHYLGKALNG